MLVFAVLVAVAAANLLPGDEGYDEHDHDHHHHHDHEHEHHEHEHHEHEHHHHETSENAQPIAIVKSASESDPNTGKYSFRLLHAWYTTCSHRFVEYLPRKIIS